MPPSHQRLLSASTLIGDPLISAAGERLGRIEELLIDPKGVIGLVAVTPAPDLGRGEQLLVVPWEALTLDSGREEIVLDQEPARMQDAPAFDPDRWPDVADEAWVESVHAFYGTRPRWASGREREKET